MFLRSLSCTGSSGRPIGTKITQVLSKSANNIYKIIGRAKVRSERRVRKEGAKE